MQLLERIILFVIYSNWLFVNVFLQSHSSISCNLFSMFDVEPIYYLEVKITQ